MFYNRINTASESMKWKLRMNPSDELLTSELWRCYSESRLAVTKVLYSSDFAELLVVKHLQVGLLDQNYMYWRCRQQQVTALSQRAVAYSNIPQVYSYQIFISYEYLVEKHNWYIFTATNRAADWELKSIPTLCKYGILFPTMLVVVRCFCHQAFWF